MNKINEYNPQLVLHPSETLKEKLEEIGIGPKEFALRTDKPEKTITAILNGSSSITPDMAVQFENVLGIPAHFWLNKQRSYDEFLAREKRKTVVKQALSWAAKFPVSDMCKKHWIQNVNNNEEKAISLLYFFGFSNHKAWESYYYNRELKVAFRISLAHVNEPYAISAWLRKGELQASELKASSFTEKKLKGCLKDLKNIMVHQDSNFFSTVQNICLNAGVKVVHTPCLPKAPINGAARWINDTPLIQLSNRYKRNDIFWFTLFHEIGHILLHGKKDIFLEDIEYPNLDTKKEVEANEFAGNVVLTEEQYSEALNLKRFSVAAIIALAEKFNTHPAIIIGRLHKDNKIKKTHGHRLYKYVDLP
ncbi:MAG TPA: HigA family addiction module antitoxin [Ignavibacteria bacterium]|nr:addiction module antidote protein, HigA family [Bacteroidota bacterium]HRF66843.1 HigA family addiction module antitoxin [Ignavibacteria bacterium]HRJ03788.1 HigA family addiction module antitoxin [Ignavibacteria bacterium]